MRVQNELLTQIAIYLKVNIYELFVMAFKFEKIDEPEYMALLDYERFIKSDGTVIPQYVSDFIELIVESI